MNSKKDARKRVILMIAIILISFVICWCPFHIEKLVEIVETSRTIDENVPDFGSRAKLDHLRTRSFLHLSLGFSQTNREFLHLQLGCKDLLPELHWDPPKVRRVLSLGGGGDEHTT